MISDKLTCNIQDVDGCPLKSALQSWSGEKQRIGGPLGREAKYSHPSVGGQRDVKRGGSSFERTLRQFKC